MAKRQTRNSDCLLRMILDAIDKASSYLKLDVAYSNRPIKRERAFCYELYHQMRLLQDTPSDGFDGFTIHGEIDKRGHRLFAPGDQKNPDFVFHVPGTMSNNLLAMEVKTRINIKGVTKDFVTLRTLLNGKYQYKYGVFLLINNDIPRLWSCCRDDIGAIENIDSCSDRIFIICKPDEHSGAAAVSLKEFLDDDFDATEPANSRGIDVKADCR